MRKFKVIETIISKQVDTWIVDTTSVRQLREDLRDLTYQPGKKLHEKNYVKKRTFRILRVKTILNRKPPVKAGEREGRK